MASVDGNAASGTNGSITGTSGDSGHTSSTVNIKSEPDYSSATNVDDDANAGPAKAPYIPPTGKVDPEKLQKYQFTPPPDCPVFHPTAAEFSMGPIEYINKIRPAAEKYGICKIIIPKCHPLFPFSIDIEKFHFTPRNQRLSELEASTRAYLHFNERLYKFWELQGLTIKHPTLEKKFIDFYELHRLVREEGGYDMVTRDKKWQKICLKMNYAKHNSSTLRSYYEKYLYSYDLFLIGATRPHRKQETKANIIHNNNNNDNDKKISSPTHGNDAEAVKTTEQEVVKEEEAIESSEREAKKGEDGGQDEKNFKQNLLPQNEKQPYQQQRRQQQQQPQAPIVHHSELRKLQTFGAGPRMPGMFSFAIDDPMKQSGKGKVCHQCGVMQFNPLNSHNFLTCAKCDISYHRLCVFPPLNDAPKGPWNCQSCIAERLEEHAQYFAKNFGFSVSGKTFNLMEFGEMADKFKRDYFDMQPEDIPLEMVEKEFWRILSTRLEYNPLIVEYGADLHTNHYGSGFPTRDNRLNNDMTELIESPWNLNNLPTLSGSVFRHINTNINGMVIPWMYVGMCFSAFCWHNEDHWTYSINYLHWGEPKIWYGVPGDKAEVFEEAMKKIVPNLFEEQPDLLHLLVTTCNPNVLVQHNVPIYKATQEAGQFIVTFPRSYHAGFNQGFNFAEAVNFAPPDWIPIGRQSMVNYSLHRRYPVFAHDELICKMSDHPNNLTDRLLEATYHDLLTMIETEKRERRRAAEMGINRSEFCRFETKIDDERQCQFCCTTCFTLAVRCPCCENKLACLPHFDKLCVCGKCEADNFVLLYRYTMSELRIIKHQLENFMAQRKRWSKSTEALLKDTRKKFQSIKWKSS